MATSPSPSRKSSPSPSSPSKQPSSRHDIRRAVNLWLGEGRSQGHSEQTHVQRQTTMDRFCWWVENELGRPATLDVLEPVTIREFLIYLREERPEGRWGTPHPNAKREVRPWTVATYYAILKAFFNFCTAEHLLRPEEWPLENVKAPKIPKDQVQPFTTAQVEQLLGAARQSCDPERDVALIWVLVDTGMRVKELCRLNVGDWRHDAARLHVIGKGDKRRTVCVATSARRALWKYIEQRQLVAAREISPEAPLFVASKGRYCGERLTPNGVHNLIQRAGILAGIEGVRCSPHTCRHYFAISFLRGGGNLVELQALMGHEGLEVLRKYLLLAECDVEEAHRKASPGNRVKPK